MADIFPGATAQQVGGYFPRTGVDPATFVTAIHITAGLGDALNIAKSVEAKQVTASFWTNRDGKIYQTMLDPARMGPWTNGVLNRPDLTNPRIARMVKDGINPNTRTLLSVENAGLEPGYPITAAQERACASIIAYFHGKYGVPITRQTVVGHYQFDSVNRPNCPSTNKAILDRIVALATATLPDSGTGDDVKSTATITLFPDGPHTLNIPAGGKVDGYSLDGLVKSQVFPTGSSSIADGTARITQDPQKAPNGTFYRCSGGIFSGLYLLPSQLSDAGPVNPPTDGSAELAACRADLAAATDALHTAETRIVQLKAEEARHGQVVANT